MTSRIIPINYIIKVGFYKSKLIKTNNAKNQRDNSFYKYEKFAIGNINIM